MTDTAIPQPNTTTDKADGGIAVLDEPSFGTSSFATSSKDDKSASGDHLSTAHHSSNPNNPNNPNNTPDPKRPSRAFRFLGRLCFWVLVVFVALFICLYVLMGTQTGTAFILQKIAAETGVQLEYGEGNLRDGLWVQNVKIAQGEDIDVTVDRAFVQVGWRGLLARQVHLASANIDNIIVKNRKPASDEPFTYGTIRSPVALKIDNASVDSIIYEQVGKDAVRIKDVAVQSATWMGSTITLTDGNITLTDLVSVNEVNGKIQLDGEYPLDASATVMVNALQDVYIDPLQIKATGTLKRTVATVSSKYNNSQVDGHIVVQGLDDNAPFWAKLNVAEAVLPYATSQNITISEGVATASGTISNIDLRVNAHLNGKDVPKGRYRGQATIRDGGMDVHYLQADTEGGRLVATGELSWQEVFELDAVVEGNGVDILPLMPPEYAEYSVYAPEFLTGKLGVRLGLDDGQDNTWYEFDLKQKDGEAIWARLYQSNRSDDSPWHIHANWQNLVRADLPNIGALNSPHGTASLVIDDGVMDVKADAKIITLSAAPEGDYQVDTRIRGEVISLQDVQYQGVVGDLTGKGEIVLAHADKPLTWQLQMATKRLLPNAYLSSDTPIQYLTGTASAKGVMREEGNAMRHTIDITASDLTAGLDDKGVQQVGLSGAGVLNLSLVGSEVTALVAEYDGRLKTAGINEGLTDNALSLVAKGTLDKLDIDKLTLQGEMGYVSAAGELLLANGIGWNANVHMDKLNTQKFAPQSPVILTGDLTTKGAYRDGMIHQTTANFSGQLEGQEASTSIPSGELMADVSVHDKSITVNALNYQGEAGSLSADGLLNMSRGYVGRLSAKMTDFDISHFVSNHSSHLTGEAVARVNWQHDEQTVHIDALDVQGLINNENFVAKGKLSTVMALPDNLGAYLKNKRRETAQRFDIRTLNQGNLTERIGNLQDAISNEHRQQRRLIKQLNADEVVLVLGDNRLGLDGDDSHLSLDINAQTLSQVIPTLRGAVAGGLILVQDDNALPTFYVDINAQGIGIGNFAIREASAIGKVVNLGNTDSQLLINAKRVVIAGKSLDGLRVDFNGTQAKHQATLIIGNHNMEMRAKLDGGLSDEAYQGVLSEGRLQTKMGVLNQRQPAQVAYNMTSGRADVAAHCWQTVTGQASAMGSLCLQDTLSISPKMGDVDVVIQNFDTSVFTPILPSDLSWHSRLHGKVMARWGQGTPEVNAVLYSDNGTIGLRAKDTDDVTLPYQRISVIAETVPTGLKLRTDINAGRGGNGYADVIINPYQADKPIAGAFVLNDLRLETVRPFFPAIGRMGGAVNVAGGVGGTLLRPLFYGNANLSKGQFALVDVPVSLSDIELNANVSGTNAILEGDFKGGEGVGKLTGEIDWQSALQAKFTVNAEELTISSPPLLSAKVSPSLEIITRPLQKYVDIKGVVSVPEATIRPPEASAAVVSESGDVYVIDRRMTGNVSAILAQVEPWSINADIGLDLGDKVVFRGFGATLPLAGALHLTQEGQGSLRGRGVIQVSERTKVDAIGQNLDLNYAQIRFNGDIQNPRLSIEAVREIDSNTVGVRVTGVLASPNISVFNDAGLSEQQAMNALVTGSFGDSGNTQISEQGFRTQVTNNLAAAGLNLGLQGTRGITNQLGRALGLDSLVVDASGSGEDANVNVTGYITPDLYIRYGVGVFNAQSTLSLRYQLTRRVYVEASSGTENFVDMIYRWRF